MPATVYCEVCKRQVTSGRFVDGKTQWGPWANMCTRCHDTVGRGVGSGRGQVYEWEEETREWVKVDG